MKVFVLFLNFSQMNLTTTPVPPGVVPLQQRINFEEVSQGIALDPRYDFTTSTDVSKSIYDFGHQVTKQLLRIRNSKFEVISPLSIAAALNVVLLGSRGNTFNELMSTLGYSRCKLTLKTKHRLNIFKI